LLPLPPPLLVVRDSGPSVLSEVEIGALKTDELYYIISLKSLIKNNVKKESRMYALFPFK
jgi:hypothetical protein